MTGNYAPTELYTGSPGREAEHPELGRRSSKASGSQTLLRFLEQTLPLEIPLQQNF